MAETISVIDMEVTHDVSGDGAYTHHQCSGVIVGLAIKHSNAGGADTCVVVIDGGDFADIPVATLVQASDPDGWYYPMAQAGDLLGEGRVFAAGGEGVPHEIPFVGRPKMTISGGVENDVTRIRLLVRK